MKPVHSRVIAKNGLISVWLEDVAARTYAALPRVAGFVEDLVTFSDAQKDVQDAYDQGYADGLAAAMKETNDLLRR